MSYYLLHHVMFTCLMEHLSFLIAFGNIAFENIVRKKILVNNVFLLVSECFQPYQRQIEDN